VQSVEHGQVEAALAYGMSRRARLAHVIVPQALRQFLPAYGNEVVIMVKASALASTITLMEVTGIARNLASKTYTPIETFLAAGAIYLALNFIITRLLGRAEARVAAAAR
jgi:octopine/nopaline transport system permease protein